MQYIGLGIRNTRRDMMQEDLRKREQRHGEEVINNNPIEADHKEEQPEDCHKEDQWEICSVHIAK